MKCWRCKGTGDRNFDDAQVVWERCPVCRGNKSIPDHQEIPRRVFKQHGGELHVFATHEEFIRYV